MARYVSIALVIAALVIGLPVRAQHASPASGVSPDVARVLSQIKAADADLLAVSEEDGRFLRVMVASSGATSSAPGRGPMIGLRTKSEPAINKS